MQCFERSAQLPFGYIVATLCHIPATNLLQEVVHRLGTQFLHMLVHIQARLIVNFGLAFRVGLETLGGLLQHVAYNQLIHLLQLAKGSPSRFALGYGIVFDPLIA